MIQFKYFHSIQSRRRLCRPFPFIYTQYFIIEDKKDDLDCNRGNDKSLIFPDKITILQWRMFFANRGSDNLRQIIHLSSLSRADNFFNSGHLWGSSKFLFPTSQSTLFSSIIYISIISIFFNRDTHSKVIISYVFHHNSSLNFPSQSKF